MRNGLYAVFLVILAGLFFPAHTERNWQSNPEETFSTTTLSYAPRKDAETALPPKSGAKNGVAAPTPESQGESKKEAELKPEARAEKPLPGAGVINSTPAKPESVPVSLTTDEIFGRASASVVQIICEIPGNKLISGSGVIVSESGIVLTNAHVVDQGERCIARMGNPAYTVGDFRPVYVPDTAEKIPGTEVPKHDFAFGAIEKIVPKSAVRSPFSVLTLDFSYIPAEGDIFLSAAYASEFLGAGGLLDGTQNLVYAKTGFLGFYRFGEGNDIMELSGNVATQEGASGSPILSSSDGSVKGLVFGENKDRDGAILETAKRIEFAFTIRYIDRMVREKTGMDFKNFVGHLERR